MGPAGRPAAGTQGHRDRVGVSLAGQRKGRPLGLALCVSGKGLGILHRGLPVFDGLHGGSGPQRGQASRAPGTLCRGLLGLIHTLGCDVGLFGK